MAAANPNALPTWGNETTMNLNQLVYSNIIQSPYFKGLYDKKTYHEVLQEIYNKVDSLEPFMKGTVASTAFCLLFKLYTLKLTVRQIDGMLKKEDNGHIKAIALLYLRYTLPPPQLWEWFETYMDDEEEVKVERGPPARYMTVGEMAYTLLTSPKWLGSMLPRIPVPVAKSMDPSLQPYRTKYSGASAAMEGPKTSGFGGRPDTRFPPGTKAAGSGLGENRGDRKESRGGSRDRDRDRDRGGRYDDRDYRDRESGRRYDDRGGRDIYSRGRSRDRYNDRDRYGGDRGRDYDRREQDKDRYYSSGGTGGFGKYYNMTDEDIAYERRQRERESERDRERPRSRDGRDKGRESVRERSRSPDRKHQRTDSRDR